MRVCGDYCDEFYNACKDDYVCFNTEGILKYVTDALTGNLDPDTEYRPFSCKGSYECKKISETRVAKPIDTGYLTL